MNIYSSRSNLYTFVVVLVMFGLLGVTTLGIASRTQAQAEICAGVHQDVSDPLTDLGNRVYIRMDGQNTGFTGGLYPNGSNLRPAEHEAAGAAMVNEIALLDGTGNVDPANGKIVMVSVGMSNAAAEFAIFMRNARRDPQVNRKVVFVNGAQPGRTSEYWVDPAAATWQELLNRLATVGVTPLQVQVAWVKQTRTGGGAFPQKAQTLQGDLEAIARNLKTHFPNLKIAFYSSRTRAYIYGEGLSPEPNAFEGGFAVKWMIEKQINGDPELNYDPARGEVNAPFLSWGAYLWIDGLNPRSDGLIWEQADLVPDCVHPSNSGTAKVSQMMLNFFKSDSLAAGWFLAEPPPGAATPTLTASAILTPTASPTLTNTPQPLQEKVFLPFVFSSLDNGTQAPTRLPAQNSGSTRDSGLPPISSENSLILVALALSLAGMLFTWLLLNRQKKKSAN